MFLQVMSIFPQLLDCAGDSLKLLVLILFVTEFEMEIDNESLLLV